MNAVQEIRIFNKSHKSVPERRCEGEDEDEVAVFSAKRYDRRSSEALIESATLCHDAQVVGRFNSRIF